MKPHGIWSPAVVYVSVAGVVAGCEGLVGWKGNHARGIMVGAKPYPGFPPPKEWETRRDSRDPKLSSYFFPFFLLSLFLTLFLLLSYLPTYPNPFLLPTYLFYLNLLTLSFLLNIKF